MQGHGDRQDDWYNWLSIAKFTYNDQVHASTQTSPFMLDASQNPQLGFEPIHESQLKSLDNFVSRMAQVTDKARAALVKAADDMAQFYDAHQHKAPKYKLLYIYISFYRPGGRAHDGHMAVST